MINYVAYTNTHVAPSQTISKNVKNLFSQKLQMNLDDDLFQEAVSSNSESNIVKEELLDFFGPKRI